MTNSLSLRFGQPQVLPDNATAAWGARLIVTQDGFVDFVPDRVDCVGDTETLYALLEGRQGLINEVIEILRELLKSWWMGTRIGEDFIVYLDDKVTIHANTNGSYGYCYVTAWLTP